MPTLFVELGLVILGLAVLARLGRWLGLSPVPFYLLAGLAFGRGGVAPLVTSEEFIEVGAEIGVVLLLLMLGLEFSASELITAMRRSAPSGLLDVALNFTPGLALGLALRWDPLAAVFLGGITYISSSGIVAKLLGDLGWMANRESPLVLSILVFEDLAMLLYLPLVAALVIGQGTLATAGSIAIGLGIMVVTLVGSLRFGPTISRITFSRSDEALLLSIIGITLVVAGMAERLQVSAAVGAFLVGIALSGEAADGARQLLRPVKDLFAAVFFFFFGLETDPTSISPVLGVAAGLAVFTAATKVVTGWLSARWAGGGPYARWRAGALLVARGEFSIVVAGLAVRTGLEPQLGPLAAAYVLFMAVSGPLLTKGVDIRVQALRRAESRREGPLTSER